MKKFWLLAILIICGCRNFSAFNESVSKQYLLLLHNKERCKNQLDQLTENQKLNSLAQKHAEWMADKSSLVHSNLRANTEFMYMGENIARGQPDENIVLADWMKSSGHRQNILNDHYKHVGIGYAKRDNMPYWCVIFAD